MMIMMMLMAPQGLLRLHRGAVGRPAERGAAELPDGRERRELVGVRDGEDARRVREEERGRFVGAGDEREDARRDRRARKQTDEADDDFGVARARRELGVAVLDHVEPEDARRHADGDGLPEEDVVGEDLRVVGLAAHLVEHRDDVLARAEKRVPVDPDEHEGVRVDDVAAAFARAARARARGDEARGAEAVRVALGPLARPAQTRHRHVEDVHQKSAERDGAEVEHPRPEQRDDGGLLDGRERFGRFVGPPPLHRAGDRRDGDVLDDARRPEPDADEEEHR
mmetsp:Transcript_11768/g.47493  ORF Transcript_11768/g.47493 Transcript_11768/m.47493 type:complete len:282 (+) Transcript_11768:1499-2344(+)